jgi:predicted unusual protein kinase regulating ubiquinone biosynthesis (AarF/ABC1/UbiB family)
VAGSKDLPTGRLARLSRLARVGARSGFSLLAGTDGAAAAQQAVELLGNLRGLAAKVGQMASYIDGVIPEAQREVYERVLKSLQNATPASPFPKVRDVIETELGASLDELFAEFDEQPIASASIGQVHRARLHERAGAGEVAVKVQHPGIEAAIETDLGSAGSLVGLVSMIGPKGISVKTLHDEVAARFREELDYRLEAERQTQFARFFLDEPRIRVPRIIASHSARRVMASELVRGFDLDAAAQRSEEERRAFALLLWRFAFTGMLSEGMFNADPHPGNYLFHEDGAISFLDFGCVQMIGPDFLAGARGMHEGALQRDEAMFRRHAARVCGTVPGAYEDDLLTYLWGCFEPLRQVPFQLKRDYVIEIVKNTQNLKRHVLGRNTGVTQPPPGVMLLNRLQLGFYSVLARLDVSVDYAAVDREILARVPCGTTQGSCR